MKKGFVFILFVFIAFLGSLFAQELTVKSIELDPNDIEAKSDTANKEGLALIKFIIPRLTDVEFNSDFIAREPIRTTSEYKVWVYPDISSIELTHPVYGKTSISLKRSVQGGIHSNCVYVVSVDVPKDNMYSEAKTAFLQRDYSHASISFKDLLLSSDFKEMESVIMSYIAKCDSCLDYENKFTAAMRALIAMQREGEAKQDSVAHYAEIAIGCLNQLNSLNPNDYYDNRREKLEGLLMSMPMMVQVTIVKREKTSSGVIDAGPMPGVGVYIYTGEGLTQKEIEKELDKKLESSIKSNISKRMGETDKNGLFVIQLDRNAPLPTGMFFTPPSFYGKHAKVTYMPWNINPSYEMQRIRLGIYVGESH